MQAQQRPMTRPNSARKAAVTIFLLAFATGLPTTTVSFNLDIIRGVSLRGRAATIAVSKALVEDEFLDFVHNSAEKTSESDGEIEPGDVFCNRELAMSTIEAIGFDMDYTIAQYKPEFDLLAFDGLGRLRTQPWWLRRPWRRIRFDELAIPHRGGCPGSA